MENNKLIAEFMGEKEVCTDMYRLEQHEYLKRVPYSHDCEEVHDFELNEMKYHNSWDWIMPVVKKIKEVIEAEFSVNDAFDGYYHRLNAYHYDIESIYAGVVEFIKTYNHIKGEVK